MVFTFTSQRFLSTVFILPLAYICILGPTIRMQYRVVFLTVPSNVGNSFIIIKGLPTLGETLKKPPCTLDYYKGMSKLNVQVTDTLPTPLHHLQYPWLEVAVHSTQYMETIPTKITPVHLHQPPVDKL